MLLEGAEFHEGVKTQGTEQARAHGVHLGFLHPVIQLQIREAAAGDLDESWLMLQPRMPENHQSAACSIPAFQFFSFSVFQFFSFSAFQRFSVSAFQRFSVSAFTL